MFRFPQSRFPNRMTFNKITVSQHRAANVDNISVIFERKERYLLIKSDTERTILLCRLVSLTYEFKEKTALIWCEIPIPSTSVLNLPLWKSNLPEYADIDRTRQY